MKKRNALLAAALLAAGFSFGAGFGPDFPLSPAVGGAIAAEAGPGNTICADPYISRQVARGRAHWYLIKRGFERTAEGKPRVIMGKATCEAGFWRVQVTLVDYKPRQKRHETILVNASSGNVIRNISIIS